jgi:hypothetical protein
MTGSSHDQAATDGPHNTLRPSLNDWAIWATAQSGQPPASHEWLLLQLTAISRGTIDRLMVLSCSPLYPYGYTAIGLGNLSFTLADATDRMGYRRRSWRRLTTRFSSRRSHDTDHVQQ